MKYTKSELLKQYRLVLIILRQEIDKEVESIESLTEGQTDGFTQSSTIADHAVNAIRFNAIMNYRLKEDE